MERIGRVIEKKGNNALLLMGRHTACEKCGRCGILGGGTMKEARIEAANPLHADVGDLVKIKIDDTKILIMSFMLYMLPALVLVAGVFLGTYLASLINYSGDHILFAVLCGIFPAAGVLGLVKLWDSSKKNDPGYKPVIIAHADEDEDT